MPDFSKNNLCEVTEIINSNLVRAWDVIRKRGWLISLLPGYELDESFVGQDLYFDGEMVGDIGLLTDATCYHRDSRGCVQYIKKMPAGAG